MVFSALAKRFGLVMGTLVLVLQAACGGGGGGSQPAAPPAYSSNKAILDFRIASAIGSISENAHTVSVVVPWNADLTSLAPSITISTGATINPASGQARDFSSPVIYTVTAEDASTQAYTVTAIKAAPPAPTITSFAIGTSNGIIDETQHTVSVYISPALAGNITALSPTISVSTGAVVSPASGVSQDFTDPVNYKVSIAGGGSQTYTVTVTKAPTAISAADFNLLLGAGINLGNTLDAIPNEGSWTNGVLAQESYFDAYKAAGFTSVRIPITWDAHFGSAAPYAIDATFLARVKTIVGWGMSRGLTLIINAHHEAWLKADYAGQVARFEALWKQIAFEFKDYPTTLAFEILNEPQDKMTDADVNDMNARILAIIRNTNPTRNVIIGANSYNSMNKLVDGSLTVPDDSQLIATYHYYNPWGFAGQAIGTWGSAADLKQVHDDFASVMSWANQHGIPVCMGEFGCTQQYVDQGVTRTTDAASRLLWYQTIAKEASGAGMSFIAWEDAGNFAFFHRSNQTWETPILDAIMRK